MLTLSLAPRAEMSAGPAASAAVLRKFRRSSSSAIITSRTTMIARVRERGGLSDQLAEVGDPVVGLQGGEGLGVAVAVTDGAGFYSGALAGFHVGAGIADEETIFGGGAHRFEGDEEDVRGGLARETVGALHVIKMREQAELLED